ncbi:MAG: sugar-binding protein [Chitinispirillaceae bacterium]
MNNCKYLILATFFFLGVRGEAFAQANHIVLRPAQKKIDSSADPQILISSDSATILSPQNYTVLKADSAVFEIDPLVETDSVLLLVRHSGSVVDTLGVKSSPPYRAVWRCDSLDDQDQIHLQFGYTLFCKDSMRIVSPPFPHRWTLQRNPVRTDRTYRIEETLEGEQFKVDGKLSEWNRVRTAEVGGIGRFRLLWTSAKLFFALRVEDRSVIGRDFAELHIDLHQDRAAFSGINHRSIRFGPRLRSNTFVVDLTDSGFVLCDSVNVRISREMEWKASVDSEGYTIEAVIPFCVLSDLEFPPARFGLDVSIMNYDEGSTKPEYHSWSGSGRYNRYSPGRWGTVSLSQALFPLKFTLVALGILVVIMVAFFIIQGISQRRKEEKLEAQEAKSLSPLTESLLQVVEDTLDDPQFNLSVAVRLLKRDQEEIAAALKNDLDCSFEQVLSFRRIKRAQFLMRDPELDLEVVAMKSGFENYASFAEQFAKQMRHSPEVSRQAILEELEEEAEEEEEEVQDDTSGSRNIDKDAS